MKFLVIFLILRHIKNCWFWSSNPLELNYWIKNFLGLLFCKALFHTLTVNYYKRVNFDFQKRKIYIFKFTIKLTLVILFYVSQEFVSLYAHYIWWINYISRAYFPTHKLVLIKIIARKKCQVTKRRVINASTSKLYTKYS